jgi:hypothetical protein
MCPQTPCACKRRRPSRGSSPAEPPARSRSRDGGVGGAHTGVSRLRSCWVLMLCRNRSGGSV